MVLGRALHACMKSALLSCKETDTVFAVHVMSAGCKGDMVPFKGEDASVQGWLARMHAIFVMLRDLL